MKAGSRTFLSANLEQWALVAALPLNQAGNSALYTVLGPFRGAFDMPYSELGLVLASYGFARFLTNIPVGLVIRRAPLRALVLAGIVVNLLAAAGALAATQVWQVVLSRIIQGVAVSVVQAGILAWLVIAVEAATRGRVMALSEALFSIVGLLVPLGTGALAVVLDWRAAFALATMAAVLACLAVLFGTKAHSVPVAAPPRDERGQGGLRSWRAIRVGGSTLVAAYLLTFVVAFGRNGMLNTLLPVIGSDEIGLSPLQVGFGLTLANLTGIGVLMLGGWAGDRFGRRRLAAPGLVALLLCQAALFGVRGEVLYFAIIAAQGLGFWVNSYPTSLVGDALPPHLRSVGIAGYRLMVDGAILLAPVAVGFASDWGGFGAAKGLTMGITAAVLVGVWLATREPRRLRLAAAAPAPPPASLRESPERGG